MLAKQLGVSGLVGHHVYRQSKLCRDRMAQLWMRLRLFHIWPTHRFALSEASSAATTTRTIIIPQPNVFMRQPKPPRMET
jgi:hypothetical protein